MPKAVEQGAEEGHDKARHFQRSVKGAHDIGDGKGFVAFRLQPGGESDGERKTGEEAQDEQGQHAAAKPTEATAEQPGILGISERREKMSHAEGAERDEGEIGYFEPFEGIAPLIHERQ